MTSLMERQAEKLGSAREARKVMGSTVATVVAAIEKTVVCPACQSERWVEKERIEKTGYIICECQNCSLIFSNPMVAADANWYASSWLYGLREGNVDEDGSKRGVPWNFKQAISELGAGGGRRLLDVGCAEGQFLNLARNAGFEVAGLDFNPVSVEIARKLLGAEAIHQCSVEELATRYPENLYDVVTIFEVLEHTADPFQTISSLKKLLKPGGQLLISVPGSRRWPVLFDPEVDTPPHHLTLWTQQALKELLTRAEMEVMSVESKPLAVDDFGLHLMWRMMKAMQKEKPKNERGAQSAAVAEKPRPKASLGFARRLAKVGLLPVSWVLRLNPRAGGFTLFAHCEKR